LSHPQHAQTTLITKLTGSNPIPVILCRDKTKQNKTENIKWISLKYTNVTHKLYNRTLLANNGHTTDMNKYLQAKECEKSSLLTHNVPVMVERKKQQAKYSTPWHRQPSILRLASTESRSYTTKPWSTIHSTATNTSRWRRNVVVSALASINVVNRHWTRLVLDCFDDVTTHHLTAPAHFSTESQ